jgi:hypothetical protein
MPTSASPIVRVCKDCQQRFVVTDDEQQYMARLAATLPSGEGGRCWALPTRCTGCRFECRRQRETIADDVPEVWYEATCMDCGGAFKIGPRDIAYLRERGWPWPDGVSPVARVDRNGAGG